MDDTNPTARALVCLRILQDRPGVTAQQLADALGVSDRAARRYVAVLREAGVPVDSVRGPYGGYGLGRGARLPPLSFTAVEALGLVMAVLDGHHAASDPTDPVGSALGKLVRGLPEAVAAQADAVRRTAAPALDRAAARPDPATTASLVQASVDCRQLRIGYRTEAGSELSLQVEPWAVVIRHGRWYLLCLTHPAAVVRTYRVDRIRDIVVLDDAFAAPEGLDPVQMLEEHLASGWEFSVQVVIEAPLETVVRRLSPALGRFVELPAGHTRLVGSTSNPTWYAEQLAASPAPFRVVSGAEVGEAVRTLGARLLAAGR